MRPALALLLACRDPKAPGDTAPPAAEDISIGLLPEGQANHLLPIHVAVDGAGRRVLVSSNGMPTLAVVDADAGELLAVHRLADPSALHPLVAVDAEGVAWMAYEEGTALRRLDLVSGEARPAELGWASAHGLVAREGGGVAVLGRAAEEEVDRLALISPGGGMELEEVLPTSALALAPTQNGELGLLLKETEGPGLDALELRSDLDLALGSRCDVLAEAPPEASFAWMAQLEGGDWAISQETTLSLLRCPSGEWSQLEVGRENRSAIALSGGGFASLDRIGADGTHDPNWGLLRRYTSELSRDGEVWTTGKNSGYGALDPETGLVWMNSEGTAELWAMEPESGALVHRVRLGEHIESVAVVEGGREIWFSGRLSNLIGRIDLDSGEVAAASDLITWPVAPVMAEGWLYLLDQLSSTLHKVDPQSLDVVERWDLGLSVNTLLTLSDMAWSPERGTLLIAQAADDLLLEFDPVEGRELARWELAGQAISEPDVAGRVEVVPLGDAAVVVRSTDGALSRVDLESGEVLGGDLPEGGIAALRSAHLLDASCLSEDGARLWVGRFALDPADLALLRELESGVDLILHDPGEGELLAWRDQPDSLVVLDAEGEILRGRALPEDPFGNAGFALLRGAEGASVVMGSFAGASVRAISLQGLYTPDGP